MAEKGPLGRFYLDRECKVPLDENAPFEPCEAGESLLYDLYVRNEGTHPYETWEIKIEGEHLELVPTPRPRRLEIGQIAHIRFRWNPPEDYWKALKFEIEINGPFIISNVD